MKTVKQWITNSELNRVFIVLLAGVLVFLNVACSNPDVRSSVDKQVPSNQTSSDNGTVQRKISDNYNGFPDNDPKFQGKARALIENTKKNSKDPEGFVDSVKTLGERASNLPKDLSRQAEQQKDELVKVTKRDMRNLKNNLEKASNEVPKVVEEAKENAKQGMENSLKSAKDTADMLKTNVQETVK